MCPGNGYIPTSALKEILHELDAKLTDQELEGIIEEIDDDGSGTVDFDGEPWPRGRELAKLGIIYIRKKSKQFLFEL